MVTVNVVEESTSDSFIGFEEFKNDYINTKLTKKELINKHKICESKYNRWRKHVISETGFKRRCYGKGGLRKSIEELNEIFNDVANKYTDGMKVHEIKQMYNLNQKEWTILRNRIKVEFDYERVHGGSNGKCL